MYAFFFKRKGGVGVRKSCVNLFASVITLSFERRTMPA